MNTAIATVHGQIGTRCSEFRAGARVRNIEGVSEAKGTEVSVRNTDGVGEAEGGGVTGLDGANRDAAVLSGFEIARAGEGTIN